MDCIEAHRLLHAGALIRACDVVRPAPVAAGNDVLRVQSVFRYPGGEYVDLYFHERPNGEAELSDDGFTMGLLLSMGVDPDVTQRRKHFIADVCDELGLRRRGGEFVVALGPIPATTLAGALLRLGQGCVRISDLALTHRTRLASPFNIDLKEDLELLDPNVRRDVPLFGRAGRQVVVDYIVHGETRENALLTMTAKQATTAHNIANDTFTKWFDLQDYQTDLQFVTVLEGNRASLFRPDDIARLEILSDVIQYPEEAERLRDLLAV